MASAPSPGPKRGHLSSTAVPRHSRTPSRVCSEFEMAVAGNGTKSRCCHGVSWTREAAKGPSSPVDDDVCLRTVEGILDAPIAGRVLAFHDGAIEVVGAAHAELRPDHVVD